VNAERMAVIRLMIPYLGKHRILLALGIAGTAVNAVLSFSLGVGIKHVVDGVPTGAQAGYEYLNTVFLVALPSIVLWLLFSFFVSYSLVQVFMRVVRDLRDNVFATLIGQEISYLERHSSGELQTRLIADTNIVAGFATGQIPTIVAAAISLVAGTGGALLISLELTLIVLAALPLVFLPVVLFGRKIRDFGAKIQQATAELGTVSGEAFRSIKVAHVNNQQAAESSRFRRLSDMLARTSVRASRLQLQLSTSVQIAAQSAVLVLLYTAARGIYSGVHSVGELMAFAYFNSLIVSATGTFLSFATALKQTTGSAERIMEYLFLQGHPWSRIAKSVSITGAIEFRDVRFKYPARPEIDVLRGISFGVEAGTSTVIVGPSGAGKSALFELLLGLYSPDAGIIFVDGSDCRELARDQLRACIGYVPQKESLVSGTVFDNIVYGARAADEAQVVAAAKLACAHDFILQLPQGYQTDLGEIASRLSGGEKQRISLARALIKEPKILLLDEDRSALDADSERRVSDSVRKWAAARGVTVIAIAHRLASINRADRIVVVESGVVAGCGFHAQLMEGCETYRTLVSSYSRESGTTTYEERMPALATADT
jgi:ATP-binding cassette subfamily B protein